MTRSRFWLLFILGAVATTAIVWQHATEEQKRQLLAKLGVQLPAPTKQPLSQVYEPQLTSVKKTHFKVEGWQMGGYQCAPETKSVTEVEPTSRIYKWVDKQGKVHFTDKAPQQHGSTDLSNKYQRKEQYFRLTVAQEGKTLPVWLKDKLTADTRKVFQIMTNRLSLEDLRQVTLTIKVFDQQSQFDRYRSQVAPATKTNSGFYNPKLNIAAVMRQRNDQNTYAVARHEATHVIIAGLFGFIPSWFTEGLAEYFEQLELSGQLAIIKPNKYWLNLLARQLDQNQLMGFDQYFGFNGKNWYAQDLSTMYATAWSIVFYLMEKPESQELLGKYMKALSKDKCQIIDAKSFFNQNYPGGLMAFEKGWRKWIKVSNVIAHRY